MELYQRPSIALTLPNIINDSESLQSIIDLSQVCRRWRDVITTCPELWRHFINPHHPVSEWTQLLLERSGSVGITFVDRSPDIIEEASVLLREVAYADRLVSYSVALQMDCQIWNDPSMPMHWSQLQFLCLTHLAQDGVPDDATSRDENLLLPAGFPSCEATPKLERLHLHRCAFGNVSQITGLSKLKELRISEVRGWTTPQWVEITQQLPHLRILSLDRAISRIDNVAGDPTVWDETDSNRMYDLELEEFCLRDETFLCAKFFKYSNIMASSIFQLECLYDEALRDGEFHASFIYHRITPIIHKLVTTNPAFSNCALRIALDATQCLGLPENLSLDRSIWPEKQYSGAYLPNGACVTIVMEVVVEYQYHARMFKQLFQPIFNRVESFTIVNNGHLVFEDDIWLSDLLWQSSHRLRQLVGVPIDAVKIIENNMFSFPDFNPPFPTTAPFLYALEELRLCVDATDYITLLPFVLEMKKRVKQFKRCKLTHCLTQRYPVNLIPGEWLTILPNEVLIMNPLLPPFEHARLYRLT